MISAINVHFSLINQKGQLCLRCTALSKITSNYEILPLQALKRDYLHKVTTKPSIIYKTSFGLPAFFFKLTSQIFFPPLPSTREEK